MGTPLARSLGPAFLVALLLLPAASPVDADGPKPLATDANHVAIQGYDPVGYFTDGKAIKGSPTYEYSWDDATWWFASAAHRDLFAAEPDRFMPQYGGYCAAALVSGVLTPANPEAWAIVDGKLYMFRGKTVIKGAAEGISEDINEADKHWSEVGTRWAAREQAASDRDAGIGGYDPVAYFVNGRAVKGSSEFELSFDGRHWYFTSAAYRDRFAAAPERYRPQYDGRSAMALSEGQDVPGDPEVWTMVDGKLYLNHSALAQRRMMVDAPAVIAKADIAWAAMR